MITFFVLISVQSTASAKISSKVLYLTYKSYPYIAYSKQKLRTVVKAKIFNQEGKEFSLETKFYKSTNVTRITENLKWTRQEDGSYEMVLDYKVGTKAFKLPDFNVYLKDKNSKIIDKTKLSAPEIAYRNIASKSKQYSRVIASSLAVDSVKTTQYKNNQLLVLVKLHATNSNLEDFKLLDYENQGAKDLTLNEHKQTLFYFAIVPVDEKIIRFDYYNIKNKEFVTVSLPVILNEDLVSTQTDLNPYENNMMMYKKIAIAFVVFIFLVLYYFIKDKFYLFFAIVFTTGLFYLSMPNEKISILKDTKVYILPTVNSTVFKITKEEETVEILVDKEKFRKVLFENSNIGWIKK